MIFVIFPSPVGGTLVPYADFSLIFA